MSGCIGYVMWYCDFIQRRFDRQFPSLRVIKRSSRSGIKFHFFFGFVIRRRYGFDKIVDRFICCRRASDAHSLHIRFHVSFVIDHEMECWLVFRKCLFHSTQFHSYFILQSLNGSLSTSLRLAYLPPEQGVFFSFSLSLFSFSFSTLIFLCSFFSTFVFPFSVNRIGFSTFFCCFVSFV